MELIIQPHAVVLDATHKREHTMPVALVILPLALVHTAISQGECAAAMALVIFELTLGTNHNNNNNNNKHDYISAQSSMRSHHGSAKITAK